MKEEALKLADELDKASGYLVCIGDANFKECADMIRKLVAELDKAELAILDAFNSGKGVGYVDGMQKQMQSSVDRWVNATAPQKKPLSDDNANQIYEKFFGSKPLSEKDNLLLLIKAIIKHVEERHGIK